jgi:hypothetical protein
MFGSHMYKKSLIVVSAIAAALGVAISAPDEHRGVATLEIPAANAQSGRKAEPGPATGKTIFSDEPLNKYRLQPSSPPPANGTRLAPHKVHAFVEGIDTDAREMEDSEVKTLNDLWATQVLRPLILQRRNFPKDIVEILAALKPLEQQSVNRLERSSFLIGEGGQIPVSAGNTQDLNRTFRYVIAWKSAAAGSADIFLSVPAGNRAGVNELIAWDPKKQAFNFYRRMDPDHWFWRGDTSHAFDSRSAGQGCFACHPNGTVLMKELHRPWQNWHSEEASISATVVPENMRPPDIPELKALFDGRAGAQILEELIKGGIGRSSGARTALHGGKLADVPSLFRQLIDSRNPNLLSSRTKGLTAGPTTRLGIPVSFFFNNDAFVQLALQITPANTSVSWPDYQKLVVKYGFTLATEGFERAGDTFFSFLIPEPAFENVSLVTWMMSRQIVSSRFAICLHMVDFPNPVYSPIRDGLLKYVAVLPVEVDTAEIATLEQKLVAAILNEASRQGSVSEDRLDGATAEQQFSFWWNSPTDTLNALSAKHISDYLRRVAANIGTPDGRDAIVRLSISRRNQYRDTLPGSNQAEFDLLLPRVTLDVGQPLRMRRDGTVETSKAPPP